MLRTRGRKIVHDILARKGRTALVSLSILIGVFGAVTLISTNDLIISQIEQDINPDEIAMTRLFVTVPTAGTSVTTPDGQDQVLDLARNRRRLPGVTHIEGQVAVPIYWQNAGDTRFKKADLVAYSEPFGQIRLEPMRLISGEWPQPGQNQVAIERRMADQEHLDVGDTILFRSLAGESEPAQAWTISAIVFHPYWVETGAGNDQPEQRLYATLDGVQRLVPLSGFTAFYLRYIDTGTATDEADDLTRIIAAETNYIPMGTWLDDPDNYFLIGEVKNITNILNMLAVVALVVAGFLVMNVVNTIVVEQKRQIGVMKSIGATRLDTFIIYAGIALLYGVIGTIPGLILGSLVGAAMAQAVAPLAFTLIEGFHISTLGIVIGAVMGLLVPVLAAALPVFSGTRVTILEALTDLGIASQWGSGRLARLINALPLPVNVRQALSNVAQKKGRLALTVITLTLAAAAFMGVYAMFNVVAGEIDRLYNTFNFEIMVIPTEAQDFEQMKGLIQGVEGIEDIYPGVGFMVKVLDLSGTALVIGSTGSEDLQAFGYDPTTTAFDLTYTAGTGWRDDPAREGLLLTSSTADSLNKQVGDSIVIAAGGRTKAYEIIGIVSYPFDFALMKWEDLARQAGFVQGDNGTPADFSDDPPVPTALFVRLADREASADQVAAVIDDASERLVGAGITANFINQVKDQEDNAQNFLVFNMIFQITSAVMAAVGAIGLLTTLSMAVFERQKEIGVMRSIGAGSGTIVGQFLVEGILIGLLAWVLAIPLSYLLAVALLNGVGFGEFIQFSYPLWVLGLGLVGMLIIATIASLWPSVAAARRTVSDILRYQ